MQCSSCLNDLELFPLPGTSFLSIHSFLCPHSPLSFKTLHAQTLPPPINASLLCPLPWYLSVCLLTLIEQEYICLRLKYVVCFIFTSWQWKAVMNKWGDRGNPGEKLRIRDRNSPTCPWPAAGSRPSSSQHNSAQNCAGRWGMPQWYNCHAPVGSNRAGRAVTASSPGEWIQRWPLVQSCHCRPKSQESYMAWSTGVLAPVPKWTVRRHTVAFRLSKWEGGLTSLLFPASDSSHPWWPWILGHWVSKNPVIPLRARKFWKEIQGLTHRVACRKRHLIERRSKEGERRGDLTVTSQAGQVGAVNPSSNNWEKHQEI